MLKLFVWEEFSPDWACGLAFAVAYTEQEARELVILAYGINTSDWGPCQVFELNVPRAFAVGGGG